ncbi:hypothetical protein QBC33DRAFT_564283 [Phialemonium atrogriseum]|uniref:Uncharacterized protein n=1 Tax=Phialemonium atrogriseum TaxID=1093897 RepID=A0AAJ0BP51_9PEZI|nr:uncharacterized protein QBC33DRAFT_564283 [Phialemonium atrogriseum]KAK1761900.1 hypothetical protein QBC33DRAFT_564283 [Phialemonium atrogriseum]
MSKKTKPIKRGGSAEELLGDSFCPQPQYLTSKSPDSEGEDEGERGDESNDGRNVQLVELCFHDLWRLMGCDGTLASLHFYGRERKVVCFEEPPPMPDHLLRPNRIVTHDTIMLYDPDTVPDEDSADTLVPMGPYAEDDAHELTGGIIGRRRRLGQQLGGSGGIYKTPDSFPPHNDLVYSPLTVHTQLLSILGDYQQPAGVVWAINDTHPYDRHTPLFKASPNPLTPYPQHHLHNPPPPPQINPHQPPSSIHPTPPPPQHPNPWPTSPPTTPATTRPACTPRVAITLSTLRRLRAGMRHVDTLLGEMAQQGLGFGRAAECVERLVREGAGGVDGAEM